MKDESYKSITNSISNESGQNAFLQIPADLWIAHIYPHADLATIQAMVKTCRTQKQHLQENTLWAIVLAKLIGFDGQLRYNKEIVYKNLVTQIMDLRAEYKKKYPNSLLSFSKKKEKKDFFTTLKSSIFNTSIKDNEQLYVKICNLLEQSALPDETTFKETWLNLFKELKDPAKKIPFLIQVIDICLTEKFFFLFKDFITKSMVIDTPLIDDLLDNISTKEEYRYILIQFIQHNIPLRWTRGSLLIYLCSQEKTFNNDVASAIEFILAFDLKSVGIMKQNQANALMLFSYSLAHKTYEPHPLLTHMIRVTALYEEIIFALSNKRPNFTNAMSTEPDKVTAFYLGIATLSIDKETVRLFLQYGANPLQLCTIRQNEKISPLSRAIQRQSFDNANEILTFIQNNIDKFVGCNLTTEIAFANAIASSQSALFNKLSTLNVQLAEATEAKIDNLTKSNQALLNDNETLKTENKKLKKENEQLKKEKETGNSNLLDKSKIVELLKQRVEELTKALALFQNKSESDGDRLLITTESEETSAIEKTQGTSFS